jgi:hypothetical protein
MREAFARRTDPWTSWAAADSLTNLREKQRAALWVLVAFYPDGASLDQIVAAYHRLERAERLQRLPKLPAQSDSGLRTRVSELQTHGYVYDSGRTRRLPSGRQGRILLGTLEPMRIGDDGQMRLA